MNPFDWTGPQFLLIYASLIAMLWITNGLLHRSNILDRRKPTRPLEQLDPIELAFLNGGPPAALRATLLRAFLHHRILREGMLYFASRTAAPEDPAEATLLEVCRNGAPFAVLQRATTAYWNGMWDKLAREGWLRERGTLKVLHRTSLYTGGALLFAGVAKCNVGLARDKPIGFLVFALASLFLLLIYINEKKPMLLTPAAHTLLQAYRSSHDSLGLSATTAPAMLTPTDALFAAALFPLALNFQSLGVLHEMDTRAAYSNWNGVMDGQSLVNRTYAYPGNQWHAPDKNGGCGGGSCSGDGGGGCGSGGGDGGGGGGCGGCGGGD